MHKAQADVLSFHLVMGLRAPEEMDVDWSDIRGVRWALIKEESLEFVSAATAEDLPGAVDALCDLLYVTYGAAIAMGIDLEPHWNLVHRANMAKAGGPKRDDGKQLKPDNWVAPDHRPLLDGRA
jgi:predicted HAD superfamily Cof-like phosphohydrolase